MIITSLYSKTTSLFWNDPILINCIAQLVVSLIYLNKDNASCQRIHVIRVIMKLSMQDVELTKFS